MKNYKRLFTLFTDMFLISSFTFGGGFAIVSLIKSKFVDQRKWISDEEMLDITAIAESSPGAIAVNAAILVGYKIAGLLGVFVSVLATIIPPLFIITIISYFYDLFKENPIIQALLLGLKAAVAAIIGNVCFDLAKKIFNKFNIIALLIFIFSFIATYCYSVNVIFIILSVIVYSLIETTIMYKTRSLKQ